MTAREPLRVLIVEDSVDDADLLVLELRRGGFEPEYERVQTPGDMQSALDRRPWDLVISDHSAPQFDSMGALRLLKATGLDIPFIIVSGTIGETAAVLAMKAGAHDYILKGNLSRLTPAIARELSEAKVRRARHAAEDALREHERKAALDLATAYEATLEGWARALELRDRETEGHSRRVTDATLRLAQAMGVDDSELVHIRRGCLLHDIGKMGIPDAILFKTSGLTPEEHAVMRQHPGLARDLLAPIAYLQPALAIPYCHHERWDGTGYPQRLAGEAIPLAARIFAVVDVWDALGSGRRYREAWPEAKVLAYLREHAGSHFDPAVVDAFVKMRREATPAP
jgi:putative two-component system response regulator